MQTVSPRPNSVKRSTSDRKERATRLKQEIDSSLEQLAGVLDEVRASEMFKAYLDVQARFHKYSWHNSLLIMTQYPEASRVAGFQTWKKLGRHVRKGERGIMIFAPCPWRREVDQHGETEEQTGIYFKAVHVFDIAQTDGEDLPDMDVPCVDADGVELLKALESVAARRGHTLEYAKLDGPMGYAKPDGRIAIDNTYPTGQQAKTLAHEMAHCVMHFEKSAKPEGLTRSVAELEAESVAYVVCRHFGLDVEVRASRYIALWDGDSKALKASLERISTAARGIIDEVEELSSTSSQVAA